jgi:hypothetical protein
LAETYFILWSSLTFSISIPSAPSPAITGDQNWVIHVPCLHGTDLASSRPRHACSPRHRSHHRLLRYEFFAADAGGRRGVWLLPLPFLLALTTRTARRRRVGAWGVHADSHLWSIASHFQAQVCFSSWIWVRREHSIKSISKSTKYSPLET